MLRCLRGSFSCALSIAGCRSFGHPSKALQAMACVLANPPKRESVSCTNVSKRQQYSVSPVAGGLWRTQNNDAVHGHEFAARATVEECSALHPSNAFRSFSHKYNTRLTFRFTRGADSYHTITVSPVQLRRTSETRGTGEHQRCRIQTKINVVYRCTCRVTTAAAQAAQQSSVAVAIHHSSPTSSSVMTMFGGRSVLAPRHRGSLPSFRCSPEYARRPLQDLPRSKPTETSTPAACVARTNQAPERSGLPRG